jgi:hypothetical protein
MAAEMEWQPTYFDPELPETFHFLVEATSHWRGRVRRRREGEADRTLWSGRTHPHVGGK